MIIPLSKQHLIAGSAKSRALSEDFDYVSEVIFSVLLPPSLLLHALTLSLNNAQTCMNKRLSVRVKPKVHCLTERQIFDTF